VILTGVKKEEGQSTLEFALTLIFLMAFIFFFLQLSLIFGFGNYAHYATFMSARAYLSAGASSDDASTRAQNVIVRTLKRSMTQSGIDRFPSVAQGYTSQGAESQGPTGFALNDSHYTPGDYNSSWLQGVRYTFRSRLFLIPMGGFGATAGSSSANSVTLTSESWLGHETSDEDCASQLGQVKGIYDNGC
jgi:hypothetical protein